MKSKRVLGYIFVIAAGAGILFSLFGLVEIWRVKTMLAKNVGENLALAGQALSNTEDSLTLVGQMTQTLSTDVSSLQDTTGALTQAIHATNPMLDSLSTLAGKTLPDSINATQTSLASAQSSALLIDNILGALSSIPFSPVAPYKPDVPLHTALAQVSSSLDAIPPALDTINTSLVAGKTNLGQVEGELATISANVKETGANLDSAQKIIDQYQTITGQAKTNLLAAQLAAQGWITGLAWTATFLMVWLLIAQLGLGLQGIEILKLNE
jgi:septal ring factor EnvC (AmiA/AmiB activator)